MLPCRKVRCVSCWDYHCPRRSGRLFPRKRCLSILPAKFIIWCNRVRALLHALLYGKEKGGDELKRAYRYLTFEDRKQIERLWSEGATPKEIACTLGVHFTTVYDELKRGDTGQVYADFRNVYDASLAQQTVKDSLKRKGRHRQAV
nr:MAG TPA: RNaseH [Caudoviricetes sp.]